MKFETLNREPLTYVKCADMYDQLDSGRDLEKYGTVSVPVKVKSVWISLSSEFRSDKKSAVAELGGEFDGTAVNLPSFMIPQVEDILRDGESLSLLARGKVGLEFYSYENKFGTQYACKWCDLK